MQEAYNSAGILGLVACGMGVTILTEGVRSSLTSDLVPLELEGVTEQVQTVALWKTTSMVGTKSLFVDYLRLKSLED